MVQRALIAACLCVMLASAVVVVFISHQANQALRASADANRQLAERFAEAQASNQANLAELLRRSESTSAEVVKHLQATAKVSQSAQAPDWIPVTFKLTRETVDGPPAMGCQVNLHKGSPGLFDRGIRRESDSAGLVDCGVVQPGDWEFEISVRYDEEHTWKCTGTLNVVPGTKVLKRIVCPQPPPSPPYPVKLRVQWPPDLVGKNLCVEATFDEKPIEFQPSLKWTVLNSAAEARPRTILYGQEGKQMLIGGANRLELWSVYGGMSASRSAQWVYGDLRSQGARSWSESVAIEPATLVLRRLIVLRSIGPEDKGLTGERFGALAHTAFPVVKKESPFFQHDVRYYSTGPDFDGEPLGPGWPLRDFRGSVAIAPEYWRKLEGHFVVRAGQVNDWTLPLPEELLNVVRESIRSIEEEPRPKTPPEG